MMMQELCLHIIDVVQNSVSAGSGTVRVTLKDSHKEDIILIQVADDGKGMDEQTLTNVQNPFYTTKSGKKVGLGIPLLKESALFCDGNFNMESTPGKGTSVTATFKKSHIDTPPVGDVKDTLFTTIVGTDQCNIDITYTTDNGTFNISINEIKQEIGDDIPLTHPEVIKFLRDYINQNIDQIS